MEGVAEEESLKGALVGWVGSSSAGQSGVPKAKVQMPESSWRKRDSDRPHRAVGSQSSLGLLFREAGLGQNQAVLWAGSPCRLWGAPLTS